MSQAIIMIYINILKFVLINQLEKDQSIIETRRLKNIVVFIQTILNFVLSIKNINTDVAFKNWVPFSTYKTEINDVFIDEANHIYIAIPLYNLTKYSDNSSDTSGSLWQFKRDEVSNNNNDLPADDSQSFKYKAALVGKPADTVNNANSSAKNTKIVFISI